MLRMTELRDIDLALASYPESDWAELAGPPLLERLRGDVGIDEDEVRGAVRRALCWRPPPAIRTRRSGERRARGDARSPRSSPAASGAGRWPMRSAATSLARRAPTSRARPPCCASWRRRRTDPQLAWRLFCAALLAAAALEE